MVAVGDSDVSVNFPDSIRNLVCLSITLPVAVVVVVFSAVVVGAVLCETTDAFNALVFVNALGLIDVCFGTAVVFDASRNGLVISSHSITLLSTPSSVSTSTYKSCSKKSDM